MRYLELGREALARKHQRHENNESNEVSPALAAPGPGSTLPEPADDAEALALLGELFWARQEAARAALSGAPDGGERIAAYRAAIRRWAAFLDGLADQGPGRDALEWAARTQLWVLQRAPAEGGDAAA